MENQLQVIVDESGLEKSKAQIILDKFQDYFEVAALWEKEAEEIVVTDASQTDIIEQAKLGRKILASKRIEIEKTRKLLKESSLREGQAIDGIAKTLRALIIPLEDYLKTQELFVQLKKAKEDEEILRLAYAKQEEDRIATEKAEQEEADRLAEIERKKQERIRRENEKLIKEIEAKDRLAAAEREKAQLEQEKAAEARRVEQEAAREKQVAIEEKARIAREKSDASIRELEEKAHKQKEDAEKLAQIQKQKHEKELSDQKATTEAKPSEATRITCPYCNNTFTHPFKGY